MADIGDPMTSTIPAVGTAGTGYASEINEFLEEVQDRLEAKVPLSSLQAGTLNQANNPITNIQYAGLQDQLSTPTTPVGSLQNFGNNLYWVSASGAVQITTGAALNAGSIGGITGDYGGSNPAQFRFVDADKTFYAYDDFAGGAWAGVWANAIYVANGATGANRVKLTYGTASNYTLILPTALPGSTSVVQCTSGGQLSASNTLTNNLTGPDFRYTTAQGLQLGASMAVDPNATHTRQLGSASGAQVAWTLAASANPIGWAIPMRSGDTITGYTVFVNKTSNNTCTIKAQIFKTPNTTGGFGSETTASAGVTSNANAPGFITLQETGLSISNTLFDYVLVVWMSVGPATGNALYRAEISLTRP